MEGLETAFQEAQVIWMVGMPEMGARAILNRTQILFGNDEEPLSYEMEPESYRYKDERVQSVYKKEVTRIFTEIIVLAQLNRLANKKVMLITVVCESLRSPIDLKRSFLTGKISMSPVG